MRKWWGLVGVVLVAACGEDKTAELTAQLSTTTPTTTAVPATPSTTGAKTTTTIKPFSEYRDQVIDLIEGVGDRVDTIDMLPDGDRQVLRISYTSAYSTADYLSHQGWEIATKLTALWDGNEANGSGLNLDLTVSGDNRKLVYHYVCKGEVMDRVQSRKIVEADWVAACKV